MHIKRYQAASLPEALRSVKAELGPDALILSAKTIRPRLARFGGFAKSRVEVTAAVDREQRRATVPGETSDASSSAPSPPALSSVAGADAWRSLGLSKALLEPLEGEVRALRQQVARAFPDERDAGWVEELGELRAILRRVSVDALWRRPRSASPAQACEGALEIRGFPRAAAQALAAEAIEAIRSDGATGDPATQLEPLIASRLDPRFAPPRPDDDAPVHLLVGAPGVGKSTSVAKLATRSEACAGSALLSADSQREGAVEALRACAGRAGIPFATALTPEETLRSIARLDRERVLIDTRGCGRRDREGQRELLRLRESLGARARVHWVVSATSHAEQIRLEAERFDVLRPDSMILTRVDEAVSLAHLYPLLVDPKIPVVSWFGVGQHVPDDLEIPDPARVAQNMLGASL